MSAVLRPYPAYKDSGVPWFDLVPSNWRTERLKHVSKNVVDPADAAEIDGPCLSLEDVESWTGRIRSRDETGFTSALKRFGADDVLFGKLRPYLAKVARPALSGGCVGEFLVLRPSAPQMGSSFLAPLLRSAPFIHYVNSSTFGAKMPRAEWSFIGSAVLPLPPPDEQRQIAAYLTHADRRISRLIASKRRLIALLEEQKQAVIQHAVTRGLDPNVRLRPSGVPWLGDLPEGWEVVRLKQLARATGGMTPSRLRTDYWVGETPWISPKDMKRPDITESRDHISLDAIRDTGLPLIEPGAVLIVVRGMILARSFPVAVNRVPLTINQDMKALRPGGRIGAEFLRHVLKGLESHILSALVEEAGHGTRCLRTDEWGNLELPLPSIAEQRVICDRLDVQLESLDAGRDRARRQIDLLREYRTRLIADVVTGKLDVRGVELPPPADDDLDAPDFGDEPPDADDAAPGDDADEGGDGGV